MAKLIAIRRKVSEVGIWSTTRLIVRTVFERIFRREELLYYVDLPGYGLNPATLGPNVTTREVESSDDLTDADVAAIQAYAGTEYMRRSKSQLTRGWRLWLGYVDGQPAGGAWVLTNRTEYATRVVPLLDTDISIVDCFTYPASRGKRVYPAILASIAQQHRRKGDLRAFIFVNTLNTPSIMGIERAGFRRAVAYTQYHFRSNEIIVWKDSIDRSERSL